MGLKAKLIFSLVIFFVIFGLRFLCANCELLNENESSTKPSMEISTENDRFNYGENDELTTTTTTATTTTTVVTQNAIDVISGVTDKNSVNQINQHDSNHLQNRQPRTSAEGTLTSFYSHSSHFGKVPGKVFQDGVQGSTTQESPSRRRRVGGRKRKRRPQGFTTETSPAADGVVPSQHHWRGRVEDDTEIVSPSMVSSPWQERRDVLPTSSASVSSSIKITERIREPLLALEKEQKLSELREKQRKEYALLKINNSRENQQQQQQQQQQNVNPMVRDKSYRKPYSQAKREEFAFSSMSPMLRYTASSPSTATGTHSSRTAFDLKNILKNSGGLSLSEILQQKNLSLEDLLKGKQNALLALQNPKSSSSSSLSSSSSSSSSGSSSSEDNVKFVKPLRRIPISYLTSPAPLHEAEAKPVRKLPSNLFQFNRKPIPLPTSHTSQEAFPQQFKKMPHFNHNVDATTPKSIQINEIAPENQTHPVDSILLPNFGSNLEILTYSDDNVDNRDDLAIKSKIINDANREIEKEAIYQVSNYNVYPETDNRSHDTVNHTTNSMEPSEEPQNESIEDKLKKTRPEVNLITSDVVTLEDLFNTTIPEVVTEESILDTITSRIDQFDVSEVLKSMNRNIFKVFTPEKPDVTERNPSLFADITSDRSVDDRTDLLELIEDRRSGSRLFKVLAQRNMTLDELIEHRQRGSSQLHLSEILNNKTRSNFPFFTPPGTLSTTKILPQISRSDEKLDIVTAFENFPHFDLANLKSIKPDEIKLDSQGSSYFTSIIDIKPTDEIYKEGRSMKNPVASEPDSQDQQAIDQTSTQQPPPLSIDVDVKPFPQWKNLGLPASYSSQENNYIDQGGPEIVASSHISSHHISNIDVDELLDPVLQIEDEVARAHDLLDLELSGHGLKRNAITIESAQIPMGVRSAIIASSAIVGVSLVIFLVIFITCRWRQRRHKKLTYADQYNAIKTRLPVISRQSSSTISNIGTRLGTISGSKRTLTSSPSIFPDARTHKLNTMDPNSPEVQEYLFDAMRKPFQ